MNVDAWLTSLSSPWVLVGFLGQAMFSLRFVVQWVSSERLGKSHIPVAFWYFSLAGGAILLAYVIQRHDPVLTIGQGTGLFIYARNLHLILRERRKAALPG